MYSFFTLLPLEKTIALLYFYVAGTCYHFSFFQEDNDMFRGTKHLLFFVIFLFTLLNKTIPYIDTMIPDKTVICMGEVDDDDDDPDFNWT